jgi:hypothetical protein
MRLAYQFPVATTASQG